MARISPRVRSSSAGVHEELLGIREALALDLVKGDAHLPERAAEISVLKLQQTRFGEVMHGSVLLV